MDIVTGTPETRTHHSTGASGLGVMTAVGLPALVAIVGIAMLGWSAISWAGAVVYGFVLGILYQTWPLL